MKVVLAGLIGTYASRNSDFGGYWLLGQLPLTSSPWVIDLLGEASAGVAPTDAARRLAVLRFRDQMEKVGFQRDRIAQATLEISVAAAPVSGWQGEYASDGDEVRLLAHATLSDGRTYTCEASVFVAPHDPTKESRRAPEQWGT